MIPPSSGGRRKSKNNPEGMCGLCGRKVINKSRNAKYCSSCTIIIKRIKVTVSSRLYDLTKRDYPQLKMGIIMDIEHRTYKHKVKWYFRSK